ncbi:scarecrow-like protein 22 [Lycium ferocissimum]|uniref:scarecrow-like protein 22 n=1 Tax=Lycium ferocissimum TaxID=112874 RepID=UPI00281615B8|nr:scarecrow-like protein 22 [Lycium ferocissimum]
MKGMPLPFEFEGKGVLDLEVLFNKNSNLNSWNHHNKNSKESSYFVNSPSAVLDTIRSPRPITSSSTLSSSLGGGGGGGGTASTDTAGGGVAAVSANKWQQDNTTATSSNVGGAESEVPPQSLEMGAAGGEKCAMEEWEGGLSESVMASPCQEQSILRWIMGDVDDPSMANLNKVLQVSGPGGDNYEFNGGFGVVDQGFGVDPVAQIGSFMPAISSSVSVSSSGFPTTRMNSDKIGSTNLPQNPIFPSLSNNLGSVTFGQTQFESTDLKPQSFNSQFLINQHQTQIPQNPSFLLPLPFAQQEQNLVLPPQAKRQNLGGLEPGSQISKGLFGHQQPTPSQLQLLPHFRPGAVGTKPKMVGEEMGQFHQLQQQQQQQQQGIIDQLFKAAELVQTGNPVLAQGILARLNHQLSPIGKPFYRAAFYCKEALQLLLHANTNNFNNNPSNSPFSLIFKIGAYKSFSEISPVAQFANFTCNQALLEVLDGFERIHIVDFDIGYGGQWASLMQELALRSGGAPTLKITALASPSTHDQLELGLTRENLIHFASEINMAFEFDILSIDSLNSTSWSLPPLVSENEAIAVNLPVSSLSSYQLSLPLVLRFVKQLSPRIVVSVDRGCDRTDLPFPNHVIQALQSYSNLLESLDAVNVNFDALQKIERFLLQPGIERIVMGRFRSPERTQHWRELFLSSGFSPLSLSNFTESQAECVVKRTPVRGFHVEKRQSSLVLCWQRKELISASAWRC